MAKPASLPLEEGLEGRQTLQPGLARLCQIEVSVAWPAGAVPAVPARERLRLRLRGRTRDPVVRREAGRSRLPPAVSRHYAVMRDFDHRQLDAYRIALEFVVHAERLAQSLPVGRSALADQLRRAAMSICLNTATECAAALDICRVLSSSEESGLATGDEMLRRIVSMLTKMVMRTSP